MAHPKKRADKSPPLDVTLVLRRQAPLPAVERLGRQLPVKRRHLSSKDLASRFGPSPEDLDTLRALVAAEPGVKLHRLHGLTSAVRLVGPATALERIRRGLGTRVRGDFGFDAPPPSSSNVKTSRHSSHLPVRSFKYNPEVHSWITPYTAPQVAELYEFPDYDGRDQCIGLIELSGGLREQDMAVYFREMGIPPPRMTFVGDNKLSFFTPFNVEVTMDAQLVGSLCPAAHLVVYNSQDVSIRGYFNALCMALEDDVNRPSVLSVSWAFPEIDGLGPTWEQAQLIEELLTLAALMGISVCCACGDQGGSTPIFPAGMPLEPSGYTQAFLTPAANFAATSPLVLACGGTSLAAVKGKRLLREVVWNRLAECIELEMDQQKLLSSMATGGGISKLFPRPGYQALADVPSRVHQTWSDFTLRSQVSFEGRGTPDVAANADLNTGVRFFFNGAWSIGGGTSAATPFWACLLLLLNDGLSRRHRREVRTGWINPLLYHLRLREKQDIVRPITEGNNGAYAAHPSRAWNACAGLGSPRGRKLARALGAL